MKEYNRGANIGFLIGTAAGLALFLLIMAAVSRTHSVCYPIEQWYFSQEWLTLAYPLLCSIPFCWELYCQQRSGFLRYVVNRKPLGTYIRQRYLLGLALAASMIFLISFLSAACAQWVITPVHPSEQSFLVYELWGETLLREPLLYALLLSLWRMVPAGLIYSLGFILALFGKNGFAVLVGPFLYSVVENFVFSALNLPACSLATAFSPGRLAASYLTLPQLLVGPAALLLVTAAVALHACWRGRKEPARCFDIA